jgi:hypothetical protein
MHINLSRLLLNSSQLRIQKPLVQHGLISFPLFRRSAVDFDIPFAPSTAMRSKTPS